jgi:ADP-heptose:LPS heptosyltransferase
VREIGILNLTRFGDLIQTTPVLTGLRKRWPEARLHLIIKSRFRPVASLLPGVDCIHEIDGDAIATALSDPDSDFLDALSLIRDTVDRLRAERFDLLFNFTHSRASAVLLSLLEPHSSIGFTIDRQGTRRVDSPWLIHMQTLVRARRMIRLNLVDVYLGAAGVQGRGERLGVRLPESARRFAVERLQGDGPRLAVQLGASQDAKTWSVDHYAAALRELARLVPQLRVVLVGVAAERARATQLRERLPALAFDELVGETRIDELGAVLERCKLLLTGDTGTMHLAAAVGTPVCAVFVGLGNPYETAPYGEGHYTLLSRIACAPCSHLVRCGYPACHDDIRPDWLAALLAKLLARDDPAALPLLPQADLLTTRFDEYGLLELAPVHVRPARAEDLLALAYRTLFHEGLAGVPADAALVQRRASAFHGVDPAAWRSAVPEELPLRLRELAALGAEAARRALELERVGAQATALRDAGARLEAIDRRIYEIARSSPLLLPLGLSLEGALESLDSGDLPHVAASSASHYRELQRRSEWLGRLLEPGTRSANATGGTA